MSKPFLYIKHIILLLLFSTLLLADEIKVTFKVVPGTLPSKSKIYITGNHNKLGNWDTNDIEMEKQADGSWNRTHFSQP